MQKKNLKFLKNMYLFAWLWFLTCITVKKWTDDTKGYHLSLVHALLQSSCALLLLPSIKLKSPNPIPAFNYLLIVLIEYLLFDLIANKTKKDAKIHHCIVIAVAAYAFCFGKMHSVGVLLLLNEISTVFLNLSLMGQKPQLLIKFCFVISFFIFRILLIPFVILYCILPQMKTLEDVGILLTIVAHFGLNFYWWTKIVKKIQK